ncbi:hypothetical protein QF026_002701 [Streptomyces aurantiacus]|nr:hypothetical protein [Streptomyces aurantiacus]
MPAFGTGLGRQRTDPVGAVVGRRPLHGRRVGRTGAAADHPDALGDHETGEQADAELAEEVGTGRLQPVGPLGAAADGREEAVHVRLGEPDPGVLHPQGAALGEQPYQGRRVRLLGAPGGDGVHGVLQQFAQVDLGTGVEVMGEKVHEAAQVDLERMR